MNQIILPPSTKTGVYVKITLRLDPRNNGGVPAQGVTRCVEVPRNVHPDSLLAWARGAQFAYIGSDAEYIGNLVDIGMFDDFRWVAVDFADPFTRGLIYGTPGDVWSDVYTIGFCNEYQDLSVAEATFAVGMQWRARRALQERAS